MADDTIPHTSYGWPYLEAQNYMRAIPAYTAELADKLENADADVAAAINAAADAQAAAAALVVSVETTAAAAGFAPAGDWSTDYVYASRMGPVRFLAIQVTRTGSNIVANATGNITDASVGTMAGSAYWEGPAAAINLTTKGRSNAAAGDVTMYSGGAITIGALNGPGASIDTGHYFRFDFMWIEP